VAAGDTMVQSPAGDVAGDGGRRAGPIRRRRVAVGIAAGLVLALAGVVAYVVVSYALRTHPGPRSMSAAVRSFGSPGANTFGGGLRYHPPAAGVYELAGQGGERISFPPNSQQDGALIPASVHYLPGGCWRWHVDYNAAHWEQYDFCPRAGGLVETAIGNSQSWDFGTLTVDNRATMTCHPAPMVLTADPRRGQRLQWSCAGTNTAVAGLSNAVTRASIVATPTLRIGATEVPTFHEHQATRLTGAQSGTVITDWWFDAHSGLPVRVERHTVLKSSSPVGVVTYTEAGWWQMRSLAART
jgi:hypothetical protein